MQYSLPHRKLWIFCGCLYNRCGVVCIWENSVIIVLALPMSTYVALHAASYANSTELEVLSFDNHANIYLLWREL